MNRKFSVEEKRHRSYDILSSTFHCTFQEITNDSRQKEKELSIEQSHLEPVLHDLRGYVLHHCNNDFLELELVYDPMFEDRSDDNRRRVLAVG